MLRDEISASARTPVSSDKFDDGSFDRSENDTQLFGSIGSRSEADCHTSTPASASPPASTPTSTPTSTWSDLITVRVVYASLSRDHTRHVSTISYLRGTASVIMSIAMQRPLQPILARQLMPTPSTDARDNDTRPPPPPPSLSSPVKPARPCDACRRRKSRCVIPNLAATSCLLCAHHNQPCTFVEDPIPRKKKPVLVLPEDMLDTSHHPPSVCLCRCLCLCFPYPR